MKKLHQFFSFGIACLLSLGLMMTTLTGCEGGQNRQGGQQDDTMQRDTLQSDTIPNR